MPIARLPQLDMYYEIHGPADAVPLMLVHGAMETFESGWQKQVPALSVKHPIIGVDLRGHGRSNNPADRLDLRQMADDLLALQQHLGYEKVHMLGFSGGASVALYFAVRHLEQLASLMLVSNNSELDHTRVNQNFWDVERVKREEPRWWSSLNGRHQLPAEKLLSWWAEEDYQRPNFQPADLDHIEVPTLVMAGDRDTVLPFHHTMKLFDSLPNAYLCILPGVGHGVPKRRPDIFNQIILDFLDQVDEGVDRASRQERESAGDEHTGV